MISAAVHVATAALATRLHDFISLSFELLTTDELLDWERFVDSLEDELHQAEAILLHGQRFFSVANFKIVELLVTASERSYFARATPSNLDSLPSPHRPSIKNVTARSKKMNRKARRAAATSYL